MRKKNLTLRENQLRKKVDLIEDVNGQKIDKGIKKLVVLLNLFEIRTTGSCFGHKHYGCDYPWVHFLEDDFEKMNDVLKKCFRKNILEILLLKDENDSTFVTCRLEPIKKNLNSGRRYFKILEHYLTLKKTNETKIIDSKRK